MLTIYRFSYIELTLLLFRELQNKIIKICADRVHCWILCLQQITEKTIYIMEKIMNSPKIGLIKLGDLAVELGDLVLAVDCYS